MAVWSEERAHDQVQVLVVDSVSSTSIILNLTAQY